MSSSRILPPARRQVQVADLAAHPGVRLEGDPTVTVSSVVLDNRRAEAGDLFAAVPGARVHGASFAADAVSRGATAVLTDAAGARAVRDAGCDVPVLVAEDVRATLGAVAAAVHGEPAAAMRTFGVTGTNGKTTTTFLLDHALRALGRRTGLVGTVESRFGDTVVPSTLTTPEAPELQGWLAAMVADDVDTLSMEVSSHSIAMHRVDGIVFDVVGFTNLSQDHLDFHGTLEDYFAVKAELFGPERARRGVVVVDDEWGARLAREARVPVTTVATTTVDADADWTVQDVETEPGGSRFTLVHRDGRRVATRVALPGGFNVANAALACVMLLESGVDADTLVAALGPEGFDARVPGRMEVLSDAPRVVVDFAHNADALELALSSLRMTTPGRLVVVFGATGDRDRGKRPHMGAVAARFADVVVVTDDDPHSEPPGPIRAEVIAGARAVTGREGPGPEILEIAPRAEAIRQAVLSAAATDTVLLAGRGHETVQEVDGVDLPLDDRVEARAALAARSTGRERTAPTPHDEGDTHA
ncbi:UDP-N-acetylmuramoylalanyl-D-glutamate--2,6-diaminopimelate ligase [Flavimobilis soli]|uniref:UDP-N-acetylmuramyl-tripeptide synthetase n=1 Tax=Flavimobilis soli TaxID=442709 RepID=A0A2A9EC69_9MICO|nr:UDP-N-acetylmuramoyl-L-alanyl-D-glutamate--2,6-diaminopimelate ligase [Flavimobilis soli]PFG35885.1 UDP-N-acetylmuramoylalanyl-D-glutamate--2,6-diaminopimelate ligase [Flavimobilis soli]